MKIEKYDYTGKVYNIEVEPNHEIKDDQFYINADTGIIVHNCHPRDNIALRWLAEEYDLGYDLFHAFMGSRDMQAKKMALKLVGLAKEHNLPVVIHGRTYKPYVGYTIGSYSELVGHFVEQEGVSLTYADPLTGDTDVADAPAVILMAHNAKVTYEGTGVKITKDRFYFDIAPGSIIVDPWRTLPDMPGMTVIHYGNPRKL